jgi:hypothetical protein
MSRMTNQNILSVKTGSESEKNGKKPNKNIGE